VFHHQDKKTPTRAAAPATPKKPVTNLTPVSTPDQILSDVKRQTLLTKIQELSKLDSRRYETLSTKLVEQLTNYCQTLPETVNSYFALPGGVLDYALNRTEAALQLFQQYLVLNDQNSFSDIQKLWLYTLLSASLLKDIGKLQIDYRVNMCNAQGQIQKPWNPSIESLATAGSHYQFEFETDHEDKISLRRRLNLILAYQLMPKEGFAWIASNPETLAAWLALLSDDWQAAGTLGAILVRADAAAMLRYFNEHLPHHSYKKNTRIGTFVDHTPEGTTQAHKDQRTGIEFIKWMTHELESGEMIINQLPLLLVPGGLLISSDLFKQFVRANPQYTNWQAVQGGFLSLGLHRNNANGDINSTFQQTNNQQMQSGILFNKYALALPPSVRFQNLYTGKVAPISAIELIHLAQLHHPFSQQHQAKTALPPQHLTASGVWKTIAMASQLKPGSSHSG